MSDAAQHRTRLSSGRLLARNVGLAVLGQGSAIALAFVTVPVLIHAIGTARFGVLTLAWLLIGYAGLFDLGLGRALTKMTSERLGAGEEHHIPALFWTAMTLMAGLGLLALVVVGGLSPWLANHVIKMPPHLRVEAVVAFVLLAVAVPAVLTGSALRGFLEAHQRFDLTNGVTVAMSFLSYGGPALIAQFEPSLPAVVGVVVASRYIACGILITLALRIRPELRKRVAITKSLMRRMLGFGGWVTATSIGGAVMDGLDRVLVGAVLSASALAYYATPYQAVSQMLILSGALVGVLFPAFALNLNQDESRVATLFGQGTRFALLALFPLSLVVVALAPDLLHIWLGRNFAERSAFAMRAFAVGILFNGMAQVVFGLLQSRRPDLPAKVYAFQLPLYLAGFLFAVHQFGIDGAAVAFALRVSIDGVLLALLAWRVVPRIGPQVRELGRASLGALLLLLPVWVIPGLAPRVAYLVVALGVYAVLAWKVVLASDERDLLRRRIPRRRKLDDAIVTPPPALPQALGTEPERR